MAAMSNYLENTLIDCIFRGNTFPTASLSNTYVGLFSSASAPTDAGGGTEVSGGSYARVRIQSTLANWAGTQSAGSTIASSGTSGTTSNNGTITFPTPTADWGSIGSFGLFDAATGGNLLFYGALTNAKTVNSGDAAPTFAAASLSIQIDN